MRLNAEDRRAITEELTLAVQASHGLPATDAESVLGLIYAGELALALDTFCTQLYEYDVEVDTALRSRLEDMGRRVEVPVAHLLGDPWADAPERRGS